MSVWHDEFLERCCNETDGVVLGEGAFGPGSALWVGMREVAHFDDERTLDIRLTKAEIRRRRQKLKADERVTLRGSSSDWLECLVESHEDVEWAARLVVAAVEANLSPAPKGLPPPGADLERRRR